MSKSANPIAVGMFVVCGALLATVAIMVFGATSFFSKTETVVCYFHDSVHGLDIGAPVKYKGVRIGKVEEIGIQVKSTDMRKTRIEVVMSVDVNVLKRKILHSDGAPGDALFVNQVDEGLRAQLAFQSIVTGMLYVELDYFAEPDEQYILYDKSTRHGNTDSTRIEIPVIQSGFTDLAKKVETLMLQVSEIDVKGISENLNTLLINANAKITVLDTAEINKKTIALLDSAQILVSDPELKQSAKNLNRLLESTERTVEGVGAETKEAVAKLDSVMTHLESILAPTSSFRYEFSLLMKNLSDTSLSIKTLADYIERNPSSIITGKPIKSDNKDSK